MSFLEGFFEELYRRNKEYPQNNRVTPIHPRNYANALTQLMAQRIGNALHELARDEKYMEMLNLVEEIDQKLDSYSPHKVKSCFEHECQNKFKSKGGHQFGHFCIIIDRPARPISITSDK